MSAHVNINSSKEVHKCISIELKWRHDHFHDMYVRHRIHPVGQVVTVVSSKPWYEAHLAQASSWSFWNGGESLAKEGSSSSCCDVSTSKKNYNCQNAFVHWTFTHQQGRTSTWASQQISVLIWKAQSWGFLFAMSWLWVQIPLQNWSNVGKLTFANV